jgi:hypothetical protein
MNEVRTTFVPRRPSLAAPQVSATRGPDFVSVAATFIFVASVLAAGGVYAWRWSIGQQIEGQAAQLQKARDSFDTNFIDQATILNDRIVAANKILDEHLAPTELLEIFEQFTLRTVAFQSFTAIHQPDDSIAITATGLGKDFEAVVLQSDWFGDGPEGDGAQLKDVVFSRLGENDRGEATFNFSASLPAKRVLFSRSITQLPAPSQPNQRGAAATSTTRALVGTTTPPAAGATSTLPALPPGTRTPPPGSVTF